MSKGQLRIFGTDGSEEFARKVAKRLGIPLTPRMERLFSDGEPYIKSIAGSQGNVRECDVYIIASLYSDEKQSVNDKFIKLLFFVGSLKDAGASRVTIVVPYLAYQRQDRKTESRAGIYTKYTARLIESVGVDRLITMDVHNLSAFQSAMRILVDNLEAKRPLVDFICGGADKDGLEIDRHIPSALSFDTLVQKGESDLAILSPDSGGADRARRFRNELEKRLKLKDKIDVVHLDKSRSNTGDVSGSKIIGDVNGKRVLIYDDLIATAGTIALCQDAIEKSGGKVFAVCATHGQFVGTASDRLANIPKLITTDTMPPFRLPQSAWNGRLFVCSVAGLFADAIRITHFGGSISELLEG
jgi:ribose-phosphate pyrophosphokinase